MSGGVVKYASGTTKSPQQQQQQQQQPLGYAQQPPIVVPASLGVPQSALVSVLRGQQSPQAKRRRKEKEIVNQHGRGMARRWNEDEELQLRRLVEEVGPGKWQAVAERLATGRTPSGVEQHWQIMTGQRKRNVKIHKDPSSSDPSSMNHQRLHLQIGDPSSLQHSAQHQLHHQHLHQRQEPRVSVAPTHVVHRWTVDEEARLRALVQEIGKGKWFKIAERLGTGRSASGVEQHWQIMIGQRKRNSSTKTPLYKQPAATSHHVVSSLGLAPASSPPAPALAHPPFASGGGVEDGGETHHRTLPQPPRSDTHSPPSVIGQRSYPSTAVAVSSSLEKSPTASSGADELTGTFIF